MLECKHWFTGHLCMKCGATFSEHQENNIKQVNDILMLTEKLLDNPHHHPNIELHIKLIIEGLTKLRNEL